LPAIDRLAAVPQPGGWSRPTEPSSVCRRAVPEAAPSGRGDAASPTLPALVPRMDGEDGRPSHVRDSRQGGGGGKCVESSFDTLDHAHLRSFLDLRVRDGVLRRAIGKWLNAGVLEEGTWHQEETGTPQGGVISPLLANIYLHEVLDKWFEYERKPQLLGRAFLIRYADDFVLVFSAEQDARQVMSLLPERFGRHGLTIHPTKTRLLHFRQKDRTGGSRTFDFLGFTHHWELTHRKRWFVKRRTSASRFRRTLRRLAHWLRENRHRELRWQHERLCKAIRGHDAYYGIVGNYMALRKLRRAVARSWRKWLDRRSHTASINWDRMNHTLARWPLPRPVIHHRPLRLVAKPYA
jgi:RNA-directed DNA polymerase